jgi:hypothetical protein
MAAGLGFKDFVTGEVLTAADVDGYLMQGVWVFASAAARDAAVTSPQEGNFAYLKDTNVTTYYTGSAWANLDTTGMTNPMTTTGDTIYSSSGSTPARLGIGSTGQVLTVAAGVPSWATPAAGASLTGVSVNRTSAQSLTNDTWTAISFDTEQFDEGGFWAASPNPTRLTIPSGQGGKYMCVATGFFNNASTSGYRLTKITKNGSDIDIGYGTWMPAATSRTHAVASTVLSLSAADYLQFEMIQNSGGSLNTDNGVNFSIYKIG